MERNESKSDRQQQGAAKFQQSRGIGTYVYPTGFGKTRLALLVIQRVLAKRPTAIVSLLVHSDKKKQEWIQSIADWKDLSFCRTN